MFILIQDKKVPCSKIWSVPMEVSVTSKNEDAVPFKISSSINPETTVGVFYSQLKEKLQDQQNRLNEHLTSQLNNQPVTVEEELSSESEQEEESE